MTELESFFDMLAREPVKTLSNRTREEEPVSKRTRSRASTSSSSSSSSSKDVAAEWQTQFVSASQLQNFCLDDALCDFFDLYVQAPSPHPLQELFEAGISFEDRMIHTLREQTGWTLEKCSSLPTSRVYDEAHSVADEQRTREWMERGDPAIYSAYLCDRVDYLQGIPDLLVRNDCLHQVSPTLTNLPAKTSRFGNYYYVPVELKYSTIKRTFHGRLVTDTGRFRYYKTQLMMYARLLMNTQNVFPGEAYIVGKRVVDGCSTEYAPGWATPGRVDYLTRDGHYATILDAAIDWVRRIQQEGRTWRIGQFPYELCPNMKVVHPYHQELKSQWAEHLCDITQVWRCTAEHRANARRHKIYTWDDPRCCAATLGISPTFAATVDQILEVNRGTHLYLPNRLMDSRLFRFGKPHDCMYVDFEVLMGSDDSHQGERLFLIGVVYRGQYHAWQIRENTHKEEHRIMTEFDEFCHLMNYPTCLYWYAEADFWNRACERIQLDLRSDHWVDLYDPWIAQRIVFRGALNFKLKTLMGAMRELGLTELELPSEECANGIQAVEIAKRCFAPEEVTHMTSEERATQLSAIQSYNELDCRYVEELYRFACRLRDGDRDV